MLASKIHQYQRSNLRRILRKKICNESWCKSSNSRSMETSEESICCQKQKEVLEDILKVIAPYQTKSIKGRGLKEHLATLYYDCDNVSTMSLQHHNAVIKVVIYFS